MSNVPLPPRFVPTLTEVFQPAPAALQTLAPGTLSPEQQEQMVMRVLQRIDMTLERRLREAVGQLILEHTETLVPHLREEIEQVVRQSVNHAFDQEVTQLPIQP
ncbi:hypothetical protein [Polaromonas sp.]|uniref:hypothetical protein n=1 Tax=Polaromonas sp. TaxID=1869339 RepID=UPI001D6FC9A1|nr:hypothetical protein [Polaromonas sp.]MBT9475464.1 hypothetical protein [Polaromonas sp.]